MKLITKSAILKFISVCLFSFANFSLLTVSCLGQSITWQRTYDFYPFYADDDAFSSCITSDSNFIVVGLSGQRGIALKINSYGDTIWTSFFMNATPRTVAPTNDGGCIFTGSNDSSTAFAIRLSSNGNILWYKTYGGSNVWIYNIIKTADGNYVFCGRDWRTNLDGLIIKIDSSGNLLWQKYYLAGYDKTLTSIVETPERKLVVTGLDLRSYGGDTGKTLIMKLTDTGDTIWTKRYLAYSASVGMNIFITTLEYVIAGYTQDTAAFIYYSLPYFMRLDTNGNLLYKKVYSSFTNEGYLSFAITNNHYIFSTSKIVTPDFQPGRVYLTDTMGIILIQKTFYDTGRTGFWSILPLQNGDILFAGFAQFNFVTNHDIYIARTDNMLNAPPIGIHDNNVSLPDKFILYQNFPNPFNLTTIIKYSLKEKTMVTLEIFDLTGKKIQTLFKGNKNVGMYEMEWDATKYPSGVYFLQMTASSSYTETKKIVLLK